MYLWLVKKQLSVYWLLNATSVAHSAKRIRAHCVVDISDVTAYIFLGLLVEHRQKPCA